MSSTAWRHQRLWPVPVRPRTPHKAFETTRKRPVTEKCKSPNGNRSIGPSPALLRLREACRSYSGRGQAQLRPVNVRKLGPCQPNEPATSLSVILFNRLIASASLHDLHNYIYRRSSAIAGACVGWVVRIACCCCARPSTPLQSAHRDCPGCGGVQRAAARARTLAMTVCAVAVGSRPLHHPSCIGAPAGPR